MEQEESANEVKEDGLEWDYVPSSFAVPDEYIGIKASELPDKVHVDMIDAACAAKRSPPGTAVVGTYHAKPPTTTKGPWLAKAQQAGDLCNHSTSVETPRGVPTSGEWPSPTP